MRAWTPNTSRPRWRQKAEPNINQRSKSAALSHCATEGLKCVSVLACSTFHVRRLLMRRQLADEATVVLNTAHAVGCRVTAVGAVERRLPLGLGECLRLGFEERWAAVARAESPAPEQWAG